MKKALLIFSPLLLIGVYFLLISSSGGAAAGSPGNRTGSPGSSGVCGNCHSGGSFGTTITASVTDLLGNPVTAYIPGDQYYIEYQVSSTSGTPQYGFQSVMLTSTNANAGDFDSVLTTQTQLTTLAGKEFPEQSAKSTSGNFKVRWKAPAMGTGTVTLYYIGNAVNGTGNFMGDQATSSQNLTLTETPVFNVVVTKTNNISCFGGNDGELTATVSNGTAPYTYSWSNGVNSGSITATTHANPNLSTGMYAVTVTDGSGETAIDSLLITEPTILSSVSGASDETCYQSTDGTALILVSGGSTPYQYIWSNGDVTHAADSLPAGDHYVTVTDDKGCVLIDTVTVKGGVQIVVLDSVIDPTCTVTLDGEIHLFVSGGTGSFNYQWDDGSTQSFITGLDTGTYMYTVTDSLGCAETGSYNLQTPNQPPNVSVAITEPTCFASSDGKLISSVSGGTVPYSYSWNTGDTTPHIFNADTGHFLLVVTDSLGCFGHYNDFVSTSNTLPLVDLGQDTIICDTSMGVYEINAGLLVDNYDYSWSTGETTYSIVIPSANLYSLSVTDSVGCTGMDDVQIGEQNCVNSIEEVNSSPSISVYPNPASNNLFIETDEVGELIVLTLTGEVIWNQAISKSKEEIHIGDWAPGIYLIQFVDEYGNSELKRVVVY